VPASTISNVAAAVATATVTITSATVA